ncbi:MAG: DUF1178 family protein [Burkholderiaceae bacterium]|jgi:hypothetical protein|nr:DUF1178 family protein [Burkholderiaceae bacterium]
MALKVFDLQCDQGHLFEGWFGSHEDYDNQHARGLITCPICDSAHTQKMLSAPRLNLSHDVPQNPNQLMAKQGQLPDLVTPDMRKIQAQLMTRMREMIQATENVGVRFAQEARAIHEGESPDRAIRGVTTLDERQALAEDGITVVTLPDFLDSSKLQ